MLARGHRCGQRAGRVALGPFKVACESQLMIVSPSSSPRNSPFALLFPKSVTVARSLRCLRLLHEERRAHRAPDDTGLRREDRGRV